MIENFSAPLPSGTIKSGVVPWGTLTFAGVILGIVLIVYLGLAFGYKPFIEASIAATEARIAKLDQTAPKAEIEAQFVQFYSQLMNISGLFAAHTFVNPIFDTLEAKTKADVGFADMTIDIPGRTASMSGFARSYEILAGQLAIYEEIADIEKVTLSSTALADNFVSFDVKIDLVPEFFKFKPSVKQPTNVPTIPIIDNR